MVVANRDAGHVPGHVDVAQRVAYQGYRGVTMAAFVLDIGEGAHGHAEALNIVSLLELMAALLQQCQRIIRSAELKQRFIAVERSLRDLDGRGAAVMHAGNDLAAEVERVIPPSELPFSVPACVEQLLVDLPNGRRIIWVKCRGESQCMLTEPLDFVKDMAVLSHRVMHLQQLNLGEQLGPGSHAGLSSVTYCPICECESLGQLSAVKAVVHQLRGDRRRCPVVAFVDVGIEGGTHGGSCRGVVGYL